MYIHINKHKINQVIRGVDITSIELCRSGDSLIPYLSILYTNDQAIDIPLTFIKDAPDLQVGLLKDICAILDQGAQYGGVSTIEDDAQEELR